MQKIIIYGIGHDFHIYFDEASLYQSMTEEMGISVTALCDGNEKRFGEKVYIGDKEYEIRDVQGILEDSYDYIVVTTNTYFSAIQKSLTEKGVDSGKVITLVDYLHDIYYAGTYLYQLSIVLIIKDEASYMKEWMEYHRMLGVEHFYIYDNRSTDNLQEFLTEYIEQDIVTYQYWTDSQSEAYQHAVDNYKFESKYMAIIDVDEFLVPVDSSAGDSLVEIMDGIIAEHWERMRTHGIPKLLGGGVGVNWRVYGTGGHKKRPRGLVIENYMYRMAEERIASSHIKTIANPRTVRVCHPHHMDYLQGFACLSENGSYIMDLLFFDGRCEKLRLNHYFTRSEEELYYKTCQRGYGYENDIKVSPDGGYKRFLNKLENYDKFAVIYDPAIARFIAPLRERLSVADSKEGIENQEG